MGKSLREIGEFPAREITEWRAYEELTGPLGQERDDILAAMQTKWIVQMGSSEKKSIPIKTFLPSWDSREG